MKETNRRQLLKGLAGLAASLALPGGLAQGYGAPGKGAGEAIARSYPEDFAGMVVPQGKPFAARPVGQTPRGTSVLIRIREAQPYHYHRTHTEVAFCLAGEGYAEVAGERIPLAPGQGVLIPPATTHGFFGKMDLLSRFSPKLAGDIVFVKEGNGPAEGRPLAFRYQAAPVPSGKRFSAKPLANQALATVVALHIDDEQPLHYHRSKDEAVYVLEGYGGIEVEGQLFLAKPGRMVLIPATARHRLAGRFKALSVFTPALAGDVVFLP